jgi:hypothetical protein
MPSVARRSATWALYLEEKLSDANPRQEALDRYIAGAAAARAEALPDEEAKAPTREAAARATIDAARAAFFEASFAAHRVATFETGIYHRSWLKTERLETVKVNYRRRFCISTSYTRLQLCVSVLRSLRLLENIC